ncbi:hypothetical protein IV203_016743 [Nitzschia inconspicua]|uniref:Uncharacterized protein n=1 Tax=Nitzschia inconspicua TaxID=303405 RepID=A0A9K3KQC8_9STRA|nr:hypothetical protein IV203_016743 [Nitzschia inconspicua]
MKRQVVSSAALQSSIFRWWENCGEPVIRRALAGTLEDAADVYASDAVNQDAFIITPSDRRAVLRSFALIGRFWDINMLSLEKPTIKEASNIPFTTSNAKQIRTSGLPPFTAVATIRYTFSQRLKSLSWLPWLSHYHGFIRLYLQKRSSKPCHNNDWKIVHHDDRILLTRNGYDKDCIATTTTLTDVLDSILFFQHFRIAHGRVVHKLALSKNSSFGISVLLRNNSTAIDLDDPIGLL